MLARKAVFLVTDKIYVKTPRFISKVRALIGDDSCLYLAIVSGFGGETDSVPKNVDGVLRGSTIQLASDMKRISAQHCCQPVPIALNQSALLPGVAIQHALGFQIRRGIVESCDKITTRKLVSDDPRLHINYHPCESSLDLPLIAPFKSLRYVVKPAFGSSSSHVSVQQTWADVVQAAQQISSITNWVPAHIAEELVLDHKGHESIIEDYIEGTEFSVDGWIEKGRIRKSIVHHKLSMVLGRFIGDGPTVSPPLSSKDLSGAGGTFSPFDTDEVDVACFAEEVLNRIGLTNGVFHMEGRRRASDGHLCLIEVNPRAPGGSLWKTFLRRTGYDLELVDAALQIGQAIPQPDTATWNHVLHYPFYAHRPGVLRSWGGLLDLPRSSEEVVDVDFATTLEKGFTDGDMNEEPYLAFVVGCSNDVSSQLALIDRISKIDRPRFD